MKLNVRQAARVLSVSESEIYRWVESGEIPCLMVKHQPLFGRAELLEWATARRLPVSLELFEHGDDGGGNLRLADVLRARRRPSRRPWHRPRLRAAGDCGTSSSGRGRGSGPSPADLAGPRVDRIERHRGRDRDSSRPKPPRVPRNGGHRNAQLSGIPGSVRCRRRKAGAHGLHAHQPNDPRPSATPCQAIGCASRCRIQSGGLAPRRSRRNPRRGASRGGGPGAHARAHGRAAPPRSGSDGE